MAAVAFDTHETVKELRGAGFSEEQAEAVARIMSRRIESDFGQLATKGDIARLEGAVKGDIVRLEGEMRLLRWMNGVGIALTTAVLLRLFLPGVGI